MLKPTHGIALTLLLATTPAAVYAQTTEQPQMKQEQTAPAADSTGTSGMEQGVGDEAKTSPVAPVEGQIIDQSEDSVLAKKLLGSTVYSPNEEEIGNINDLIVKLDGTVEGVVIGVGGFLGIAEKNVAIEMRTLNVVQQEDGDALLVLNATKEELDAAPAFKTVRQQQAQRELEKARSEQKQNIQENAIPQNAIPPADSTAPAQPAPE